MFAAEAPQNAGARQSGVFGGEHIDIGIADVEHVFPIDLQGIDGAVGAGFIGFGGKADARAGHIGEHAFAEAVFSQCLRLFVGFIGNDGELDSGVLLLKNMLTDDPEKKQKQVKIDDILNELR